MFSLSLDLHVLPYFVDYSRTGSGCALEQAHLSLCCWRMRYVISWHSFQVALTHGKHDSPKVESEYTELHVTRKNF